MALPVQTTLRWATEADFDALADVMFAAIREGESPYTEAQRQAWVPEPRSGPAWRTRLLSREIIVPEADGRPLGFMSLTAGGYILVPKLHLGTRPGSPQAALHCRAA